MLDDEWIARLAVVHAGTLPTAALPHYAAPHTVLRVPSFRHPAWMVVLTVAELPCVVAARWLAVHYVHGTPPPAVLLSCGDACAQYYSCNSGVCTSKCDAVFTGQPDLCLYTDGSCINLHTDHACNRSVGD